ncbi:ABC transporter permease [Saccharothrix sp. SC076]|nr:ABC transporter permease [Saccharothrix obliqua]
MLSLAWRLVRARKLAFVGAFVAILCGSAVVAACGMLMESGLRSGVPTERYAAAPVVVGGNQEVRPEGADALTAQQVGTPPPVPGDLVGRVAAVPGVTKAVGETTFPARVVAGGGPVEVLGHNWDSAVLTPFELRAGRAPAADDEVVLDAALAGRAGVDVGGRVDVMTTSTPRTYRVVGVAAPAGADALAKQSGAYFTEDHAGELSGVPGRFHAIGVFGAGDDLADRVGKALAGQGVVVTSGDDRGTVEFAAVGQSRLVLLAISGSFGGIALLVAVFVVVGTLTLGIDQRRRELALLRAIAATPRQIGKLIGAETTLVAGVAAALGAAGGVLVGQGLRDAFAAIGVIPDDLALTVGPLPLLAAFALGLGAARLAAWVASRRPARIPPTEALGEAAVERPVVGRGRLITGRVFALGGVGLATTPLYLSGELAAALTSMSVLLVVIGLALLGPRAVGPVLRVVSAPLARFGVPGYLAAANNRANQRRLASALTPLMLSVAFAVVNFFSQTTVTAATVTETAEVTTADYALSAPGGISPEVAEEARRLPGVAAAGSAVRTQVIVTTNMGEVVEVERQPALGVAGTDGVLDLGVVSGSFDDLRGDTVALSASTARWRGVGLGDEVAMHLDDGTPVKLRVVATYERALAFGDRVLPADLARAHSASRLDSQVLVKLEPNADRAAAVAALGGLADRYPGLAVVAKADIAPAERGDQQMQFWVNIVAVGVILGYIAIAVANTLVLTTAQRRREFALLRLVGGTRRQVVRMMRAEALALVGIAVVVGSVIPAVPLALLGWSLTGTPLPSGPIAVYLGITGFAALLGLLALALPTRLALRQPPVEAIGIRE